MRDKYDIQEKFKFFGVKVGDSSLWKGITKVSKDIHKFGCWHVVDDISHEDDDFGRIWKLQVSERCISFMWILKHDRLLTNFSKSRKGLVHASSKLCGNVCEDTLHAIRDCAKAMHTWKRLVPSKIMVEFFSLDLHD